MNFLLTKNITTDIISLVTFVVDLHVILLYVIVHSNYLIDFKLFLVKNKPLAYLIFIAQ